MRIGTLLAAVVGLALPGPGWAQEIAAFDPSVGIGGYVGPVATLEQPVTVRWQPRERILGTVETYSLTKARPPEHVITVFAGTVRPSRGGVLRRFSVSELTVNGRSVAASEPLVVVESRSDSQGANVADLSIAFPGFSLLGMPIPAPDTPQYQLWRDLFAADLAYAVRPISEGDEVFERSSYHRLLGEQVRTILGDERTQIAENTFATVARGIVRRDSKRFLLVQLSGQIAAQTGTNVLTMEAGGYALIDLASGLSEGISRTQIIARQAGREVRRTVFVEVNLLQ